MPLSSQTTRCVLRLSVVLLAAVFPAQADSWNLPKKTRYYSANKKYALEVVPKGIQSQLAYFEDKVRGVPNAGGLRDSRETTARAVFLARGRFGRYNRNTAFPLRNEVSPVEALVSNNGEYVVTFDDWHAVGYGPNAVVIYRSNGTLVRALSLEDLLVQEDIQTLPRTVSSLWWGGEHSIDGMGNLVLRVVANGKASWQEGAEYQELLIKLSTGELVEPKRARFKHPWQISRVRITTAPDEPSSSCLSSPADFAAQGVLCLSSAEIVKRAKGEPVMEYPQLAKTAQVQGAVIVEVRVSRSGSVASARALSGHPLLQRAALEGVSALQFEPIQGGSGPREAVGTLLVKFSIETGVDGSRSTP